MIAEPLLPEAPAPVSDRWRARLAADPALRRVLSWLVPLVITVVAAALRLWNLGEPHRLVFDETYYVKDAWSQWHLGYATTWPEGADDRFAAGETDIFSQTGSFVVHPPLGKWLIGAGMAAFGPESAFGWRVAVALIGTAAVLVLYVTARTLTASSALAAIAAGLMAIDPLAISMSRVGLLDTMLMFFMLLAFWFALRDRRRHLDRLAAAVVARGDAGAWGPVLWNRPWLVAAGVAAGAASAVKWSGVWMLAALGLYAVVSDALARRRLGIGFWPVDAVRQGAAAFLLMVPAAFAVYLASWTGWLATDGGYARHAAEAAPATGFWAWVPLPLQNLWAYHQTIYASMAGMSAPHHWASPATEWPAVLKPTKMLAVTVADGTPGCDAAQGCVQAIYSTPNPIVWWAGVVAVVWLVARAILDRGWREAAVLTAIGATYLPWLAFPERTVFQFYTIVILPFLLLALTLALQGLAGGRHALRHRRLAGQRAVAVFLVMAVLLAAFWYPVATGMQVPFLFYKAHHWMPGWT